ncbi:MAG: hypothetical protein ABIR56_15385 [Polaromonas sp.]
MNTGSNVQAMLALVESYRKQQCERLLAEAQAEASTVVVQARYEARARVHRAVDEERGRAHNQVVAAEAQLRTVRRRHLQKQTAALLAAAWERLGSALQTRWREPDTRRAWIEKLVRDAFEALPQGAWEIGYPPDLPENDLQRMRELFCARLAEPPGFCADRQMTAGLRIRAANVILDGTLKGLLAERAQLQGELLAGLEATP